MSQVVYRGVSYDTEVRRQQQQEQQQPQQHNEIYRGVKFTKTEGGK
jgi:preprotein translocase subunit YajC